MGEGAKTRGFRNLVNTYFLFIKLFTLRCMSIIRNSFSLILWSFAHTFAVPCLVPIHFQCPIKRGHYYESSNYPDKAPVVQKLDSGIHHINLYSVDSAIGFPNTYPLERDLSNGYRYSDRHIVRQFDCHREFLFICGCANTKSDRHSSWLLETFLSF